MNIDTNGLSLGDTVRDPITGVEGVVTGFTQWFSGCAVATIQRPMKKDGTIPDHLGYDVTRLKLVTPATLTSQREGGGPQLDAPRTGGRS